MMEAPKCYERGCKHYQGIIQPDGTELSERPACKAYPDGIPGDIAYGDNLHLEVREDQDNDIVYEETKKLTIMKTQIKNKKNMKNLIADEIVIFFKTFKISVLIGCVIIPIMYFGVYQSYKCFDLNVTHVKIVHEGEEQTLDIFPAYTRTIFSPRTPSPYRVYFGNYFNQRIHDYYYYDYYNGAPSYTYYAISTNDLIKQIENCCKRWLGDRLIDSAVFGLAAFLGIPILLSFSRLIYKTIITGKNWIDKHKTPQP